MWKSIVYLMLFISVLIGGGNVSMPVANAEAQSAQAIEVTGIADVYGDGEKIAAAVLAYPQAISAESVSTEDFAAEGKVIEAVYVSDKPVIPTVSKDGRYVILKFAYQNTAYDGDLAQRKPRNEKQEERPQGTDVPSRSDRKLPDLSLAVRQIGILRGVDGRDIAPMTESLSSTATLEPMIESFEQYIFTDKETGLSMPYNLFLPQNYDPAKKYPLVFFVADASTNINNVKTPLFQGNGATVWATSEEQEKHECIVLAPQYTADMVESLGMMTTDANEWTPGLSLITNLLFDCIDRYSVDRNRI